MFSPSSGKNVAKTGGVGRVSPPLSETLAKPSTKLCLTGLLRFNSQNSQISMERLFVAGTTLTAAEKAQNSSNSQTSCLPVFSHPHRSTSSHVIMMISDFGGEVLNICSNICFVF
jgi:hypothetical protein